MAGIFSSWFCSAPQLFFPRTEKFATSVSPKLQKRLQLFADSGLPGSDIANSDAWDHWIREQDAQVRARIDRGFEDSISNLILYGTSYTNLPRLESPESAVTHGGQVSEAARARVHALVRGCRCGDSQ